LSDGVAVVVDGAGMAGSEGLKELVAGDGAIDQSACALIEDGKGLIDPLDVLSGTDGSIRVGGRGVYRKVGEAVAQTFEVESCGESAVAGGERRLDDGVAGTAATTGFALVASSGYCAKGLIVLRAV
jgi:hypothetical protein